MLSENFKKLLTIEEERLNVIRADCAPFANGDDAAAAIHKRTIDDVDQILSMITDFRAATPVTIPEKQQALSNFGNASLLSMELSSYLFSHSYCASQFRRAALQKHATMLNTIAREQVLTSVNAGWGLIEDILGTVRNEATIAISAARRPDPSAGKQDGAGPQDGKVIPFTPRPKSP